MSDINKIALKYCGTLAYQAWDQHAKDHGVVYVTWGQQRQLEKDKLICEHVVRGMFANNITPWESVYGTFRNMAMAIVLDARDSTLAQHM